MFLSENIGNKYTFSFSKDLKNAVRNSIVIYSVQIPRAKIDTSSMKKYDF